jgi:hypothetical protein
MSNNGKKKFISNTPIISINLGARCSVLVKALCYKPEGRGLDTRRGEFLNVPNLSGRTGLWGLLSLLQK